MTTNIILFLKIWLSENVIINWINALANFFYLKKSKSMNYHRNLSYLIIEKCFKLQKNLAEHICQNFKSIYIKKKRKKEKYSHNYYFIIIM